MSCNCKNRNKLERLAERFPRIKKAPVVGVLKVLDKIMMILYRIFISILVIGIVPFAILFVVYQLIVRGKVSLKVPDLIKEK